MDADWKQGIIDTCKNITVDRIDGVNYQRWMSPVRPSIMYDLMKNTTKVRESDVITTGYPRSGNHWAYDVVHMVLNQTTECSEIPFVDAFWEFRDQSGFDALDALPAPRQLVTHSRPRRFPLETFDKKPKMIFVLRNPKDVMKSMFQVCSKFANPEMVYRGSWEQFYELFMMGEFTWGSWLDHTRALDQMMRDHPDIPVHIHQFEDMVKNPVGTISNLCHFLGVPDAVASGIAEATAFAKMKTKAKVSKVDEDLFGKQKQGSLMGKGMVGEWRTWFTVDQSERFNKVFDEEMEGSKLGSLVREYI